MGNPQEGNLMAKRSFHFKTLFYAVSGVGFLGLCSSLFASTKIAKPLAATTSPYESSLTLDASNCPTTNKTDWSWAEYTIDGHSMFYNVFRASDYAADHGVLRSFYQPFIANASAFEHYNFASVTASCSTGETTVTIYGSDTLYTASPITDYTALASLTLTAGTYSTLTSAIPEGTSYSYLAIGVSATYQNRESLTYIRSITFARESFTLSLTGADSIPFGNQALAYPYSVLATYSTGVSLDVTGTSQVTSPIDTKVLGTQTFALTYQGHTASKNVEVTNVGSTPRNVDATSSTFVDSYLYDEQGLGSDASLNGRTFTFSSDVAISTGAWDLAATPSSSKEYNRFSGGYWQLGKTGISYQSLTFTSRRIFRNVTSFSYSARGGSDIAASVTGTIGSHVFASKTLTSSAQTITENCSANPATGVISFTITLTNSKAVFLGHLQVVTSDGHYSYFTVAEQANATRNYIQRYKTCPSGVSDAVVERCATEYNAMSVDTLEGTSAKAIFKTLSETMADYDYTDASQYHNSSYQGGSASVNGVNIYAKLATMVRYYNQNHSTKIYLYDDSYYAKTDNGGSNGYLPLNVDQAGHIVSPSSEATTTSMTLIIVASSGMLTLLLVAGIFLVSKKKKARKQ